MKTTVDVDRRLADEAAGILGTKSLKDTVNGALRAVIRAEGLRELAEAIRKGTLSLPTPAEVERSKAPKLPVGALDGLSAELKRSRRRRHA